MKKPKKIFVVFNTKDFGVEIVASVDPAKHKVIATKKEMLEIMLSLIATRPMTEVVVKSASWLIAKIDFASHYLPEADPASLSIPDYVSCLLEPVDGFGLTIRTKNSLRRAGIEYIWQLAPFSPTDFKDLLKLHQFGGYSLSDLKKVLQEKLDPDFFGTLKHLNVFIHETLMSKCEDVSEIASCQEYQYYKSIFTKEYLDQISLLKDLHAYQEYFPSDKDFLPGISSHTVIGKFYRIRLALRERINEYLAKVIKESYRRDC